MEQQSKQSQDKVMSYVADAMSTHPPSRERVAQMQQLAASQPRNPRAITSSTEFDRMKALCSEYAKRKQKA